ncbi:hypothetical protein [Micromonospora sp. HK10]|uniref:DUF7144 family membrane protein n=1 Tax=Micromonospora sp. HK10 TaxID=1538294 RepID=UPI000697058E|nr:hypothetical protein [Micromonospora sp. HK10]
MRYPGAGPAGDGRPLLAAGLLVGSGLVDMLAAYANTAAAPYLVLTRSGVHQLDIAAWAWLDLTVGALVALAGLLTLTGRRGAAGTAIGCAALAIVLDLLMLPYAPLRAVLVATVNAAAIRLLLRHRRAVAGR